MAVREAQWRHQPRVSRSPALIAESQSKHARSDSAPVADAHLLDSRAIIARTPPEVATWKAVWQ